MVLFVDRSLGRHDVPSALEAAGASVAVHHDYFAPHASDVLWLKGAGRHGWAILTKDHKIRHRHIERRALIEGKVRAFFLIPKNLIGEEQGRVIAKALPRIERLCRGNQPPFIAFIYANSAVKIVERPKH